MKRKKLKTKDLFFVALYGVRARKGRATLTSIGIGIGIGIGSGIRIGAGIGSGIGIAIVVTAAPICRSAPHPGAILA